MKLTQLEYFCVAARYHNITKAAKELFVTQPLISNAIKALEEEFGVNLFFRNNNKLTLTPEGELFIIVPKNFSHTLIQWNLNFMNFVKKLHLFESESHQCLGPSISQNYIFR